MKKQVTVGGENAIRLNRSAGCYYLMLDLDDEVFPKSAKEQSVAVTVNLRSEEYGNIFKKDDHKAMQLHFDNITDTDFRIGSTPVVTVDAARPNRPVRAGSITDINTDPTGNPSKVMVQTYQMIQEVIIVYND